MKYEKELRELFYMQQVYATLFSVSNKIQVVGDRSFDNLSSRQYMTILAILHLAENEANINNIAKKMGTTKQNVRQIIDVLEKKNYVEVHPSKTDKRSVTIHVTKAGLDEMIKSGEMGIMFMADLFHEFTEDELEIFWKLLKKLYEFDGVKQDGFEAETSHNNEIDDNEKERILNEFAMRRKPKIVEE